MDAGPENRLDSASLRNEGAVGISEIAADGTFVEVNEALCDMLGRTRSSLLGNPAGDIMHPDDRGRSRLAFERLRETGQPVAVEHRYLRANGTAIWAHSIMMPSGDGAPQGHLKVLTVDFTRQHELENDLRRTGQELRQGLRQRTQELEDRAAELARLTSELTVAEERERHRIAQVLHDHLQQLLVSAMFRLSMLAGQLSPGLEGNLKQIQDLLEEANEESRSLTAELAPPILHEGGLSEAVRWLSNWMREKHGLEVRLFLHDPAKIEREELRVLIFQSIRELLLNVVKHAGVSSAEVAIERPEPEQLLVTVRDDGRGFSPESLATMRRDHGGFGLFQIRERLRYLGGTFEIISDPGRGACFRMQLPAASVDEPPSLAVAEDRHGPPANANGIIRVLVADDHATVREGLCALIDEEPDLEVVGTASDGVEAVEGVYRLRPDVVVIDFSMPKMDGLAATRQIRTENPGIRIIGLSMYDEEDAAHAMRRAGASTYLPKSGPPRDLLEAIRAERVSHAH